MLPSPQPCASKFQAPKLQRKGIYVTSRESYQRLQTSSVASKSPWIPDAVAFMRNIKIFRDLGRNCLGITCWQLSAQAGYVHTGRRMPAQSFELTSCVRWEEQEASLVLVTRTGWRGEVVRSESGFLHEMLRMDLHHNIEGLSEAPSSGTFP